MWDMETSLLKWLMINTYFPLPRFNLKLKLSSLISLEKSSKTHYLHNVSKTNYYTTFFTFHLNFKIKIFIFNFFHDIFHYLLNILITLLPSRFSQKTWRKILIIMLFNKSFLLLFISNWLSSLFSFHLFEVKLRKFILNIVVDVNLNGKVRLEVFHKKFSIFEIKIFIFYGNIYQIQIARKQKKIWIFSRIE